MTLRVGSLFAGIGGFDLGFERAGFKVAWCAEWDRNAQAVLRTRFPGATVYGDIREIDLDALEPVDVICGGFPCQDLSVAGKRAGLAGARSGLFYDAMRIVRRLRPSVLILENVPGLLSSNRGLDFATVLREVGEGWDCAEVGWRVLDSQFFGVAQRRRRVFIVAGAAIGCAESILALAEGGGGDPPARRAPREEAAADASRCFAGNRESDITACLETTANNWSRADSFQTIVGAFTGTSHAQYAEGVGTLRANGGDLGGGSETLAVAIQGNLIGRDSGGPHGVGAKDDGTMYTLTKTDIHAVAFRKSKRAQTDTDDETWVDDGVANTLNGFDTGDTRTTHVVAWTQNQRDEVRELGDCAAALSGPGTHQTNYVAFHPTQDPISSTDGSTHALGCGSRQGCATICVAQGVDLYNGAETGQVAATMTVSTGSSGGGIGPAVRTAMTVRRLTPTECERLQGFPDGWTQIGRDKPTADSHRYKQLGNAVTVNVAEWIARRVAAWLTK